jgi:hypothetical protein
MAEAKKVDAVVEVVETVIEEEHITLKLSMKEARAVFAALNRVGGSPKESPRGIIDGVREAIAKAYTGPKYSEWDWDWARPEYTCAEGGPGVYMDDYKDVEKKVARG